MDLLKILLLGVAVVATALLLSTLICAPFLYLHYRLTRKR